MTSHRTSSSNIKGGAAKTATAIWLAAAIARRGHFVLVVDLDPQANATRRLAARVAPESPTVSEVIANAKDRPGCAADACVPCGWDADYAGRIGIIPAAADLTNRAGQAHELGAVRRLAKALRGADDGYSVTLIDCQPSLGHLTQMAFAASDDILIPTEPEYDSIQAALQLREFVGLYRDDLNPALKVLGVAVTRFRQQLAAHKFQLAGLPDQFGPEMLWAPTIPERACVKDANEAAVPLETIGPVGREIAALYDTMAARYLRAVGIE